MRTQKILTFRNLFLVFILPLTLLMIPVQTLAEDAPKAEGSKSKEYSQGSPHSMKGSMHGKSEGSGSKRGYSKKEGSSGKHGYSRHGYGKHGYGRYGYGGGGHRGKHGGKGRNPFRHIMHFAHALGLSADQIQQIKDKQFEFRKQRINLRAQHEIAHLELDKLVHSGQVDEAAIRSVGDRIKQIKSKKIDGMIEAKIALLKLLTGEQRKKIATLRARGAGKGHGYKGQHK